MSEEEARMFRVRVRDRLRVWVRVRVEEFADLLIGTNLRHFF
jgi:hypothetical protein